MATYRHDHTHITTPEPEKLVTDPLVTVKSEDANPVTLSEKLTEIGMAAVLIGDAAVDVMTATGLMLLSKMMLNWVAAVLPIPAASWAAFAAISTVTSPSAVGVRLKL